MANLLPPRGLKNMRSYVRDRFLGTGALVAIICGFAALLALFPVYAIVRGASSEEGAPVSEVRPLPENTDREDLARSRLMARDLSKIMSSATSTLDILDEILNVRPAGTVITNISFVRGEKGMIVLGGTTRSRDDISAYRETLAKGARFKSVTVPLGVLAGTTGSRFTLTITGAF